MKIVRIPFALLLALLAPLPAFAVPPPAKPTATGAADPDRDAWRAQAVSICVGNLGALEGVTAPEIGATCGCTVDRFMAGKQTAALPALSPHEFRVSMSSAMLSCASDQRMQVVTAVARHLAEPPPVDMPTAAAAPDGKPADGQSPGSASASGDPSNRPLPDLGTWLRSLSLPDWVADSGLPTWAWALLGVIAFLVLRGLKRGGDQRDLIGPPPNMRLGARANPPAPRRADPPQRS